MRSTERGLGRVIASAALIALVGVACWAVDARPAMAEPTTQQRTEVATQVANGVCRVVPPIPLLPKSVNPHQLCVQVLVENIDPDGNNSGIRAACSDFLPGAARFATRGCVKVMDGLLDPARKVFLDKVVPAAQKLACVSSTPAAFDCMAQQVHQWLAQAADSLWQDLIQVLTSKTQAVSILSGWHNPGVVSLYSDVGAVSATLLLGLVLVSLAVSALRFDFRRLGESLLGLAMWGLFWASCVVIAVQLIKASDAASRWLAGRPDASGQTDLGRAGKTFANWISYVSSTARVPGIPQPGYDPGSLAGLLVCALLIIAIVVTLVALLMRNIGLLLLIVMLPLTLAGAAGPRMTRQWAMAATRMFLALLLAKPLIVIAIRLGAVLVSVPAEGEPQATFADALLGVAIILLAGLLPGVVYRFSGGLMQTSAGLAPRAAAGVSEQAGISAISSMDMTRMVMERNALHSTSVASAQPGSRPTLAQTSAGGGRAAGGAAGPAGLAIAAGAMAGGALESGVRWVAGHAATGGGVLGDVEAPRVPNPPLSRLALYGAAARQGSGDAPSGGTDRTGPQPPPSSAKVRLVTGEPPTDAARPEFANQAGPTVIPGKVVSDSFDAAGYPRALPADEGASPGEPKALPPKEEE